MAKKQINKDAWLNTYADMITLILVFFVLLFSMSTLDQEKYKLLVKAFTADPETLEQLRLEDAEKNELENLDMADDAADEIQDISDITDITDLYEYMQKYVQDNNLQDSIQVAKGDTMVYIKFMSSMFFYPDRYTLLPGGKDILDDVGPAIHMVEPTVKVIRVDGHTASTQYGSEVNDRDLSSNRSNEVLKYLEAYYIEDKSKLISVGFGKYRPIAPNDIEENMAKNRRVEILVSEEDLIDQEGVELIYKQLNEESNGGAEGTDTQENTAEAETDAE